MNKFYFAINGAAAALLIAITPAAARTPIPPQPTGNPATWITTNDYPVSALRAKTEGRVMFRLSVGVDGRPTRCEITESIGSAELDQATCSLMLRRATFTPAQDKAGRTVAGTYANAVRWRIPEGGSNLQQGTLPNPQAGILITNILISADGLASDCRVERVEGDAQRRGADAFMRLCAAGMRLQGYADEAGKPLAKRVRITNQIEVLDAEVPAEPAPAASGGQAGAVPARP